MKPTERRPDADTDNSQLPAFWNKRQVAQQLGVSVRSVDYLVARRALPFCRLGSKTIRFPREAVLEHIRRNLTVHAHGSQGARV